MEATQGSPTADPPSEGPIYGPHPVNPPSGSSDGQGQDVGDNKVPNQGNKGTSKEFPKAFLGEGASSKMSFKGFFDRQMDSFMRRQLGIITKETGPYEWYHFWL